MITKEQILNANIGDYFQYLENTDDIGLMYKIKNNTWLYCQRLYKKEDQFFPLSGKYSDQDLYSIHLKEMYVPNNIKVVEILLNHLEKNGFHNPVKAKKRTLSIICKSR